MNAIYHSADESISKYLLEQCELLKGMSSTSSLWIISRTLQIQAESGVHGDVAEIGVYEGKSFIPLLLSLAKGETAVAIDPFSWPDPEVRQRFEENVRKHAKAEGRLLVHQMSSTDPKFSIEFAKHSYRFIHIDGDHSPEVLASDLRVAAGALCDEGVICIDDMLHPEFPFLVQVVHEFLQEFDNYRMLCVIDREGFVGAAKFLICKKGYVEEYDGALRESFPELVFTYDAKVGAEKVLLLTTHENMIEL